MVPSGMMNNPWKCSLCFSGERSHTPIYRQPFRSHKCRRQVLSCLLNVSSVCSSSEYVKVTKWVKSCRCSAAFRDNRILRLIIFRVLRSILTVTYCAALSLSLKYGSIFPVIYRFRNFFGRRWLSLYSSSNNSIFPPMRERSCRWRFFAREKYNRLPVDQNTRRRNNPTRRLSASKDLFIISILLYQFLKVRSNDLTLYINLIYNNSRRTLYGNRKKN